MTVTDREGLGAEGARSPRAAFAAAIRVYEEMRDTRDMEPAQRRYLIRFGVGMAVYVALLAAALALAGVLPEPAKPWSILLVVPAIGIIVWAVCAYWAEADEFPRKLLIESAGLAFTVSAPLLATAGILDLVGAVRVPFIAAFVVLMSAWGLCMAVLHRRYR